MHGMVAQVRAHAAADAGQHLRPGVCWLLAFLGCKDLALIWHRTILVSPIALASW